jgi:ParB/RepB/Spo0J family partition protein
METSITNGQPLTDAVESQPTDEAKSGRVLSIDLDLLDDNPYQPRAERDEVKTAELCESIAREGQLQPILVRPMGARWQIIFGHGRVQALRRLRRDASTEEERSRFSKVRAVERSDVSDDQMVVLALVENVQREDLSPVDCAAALDRLKSLRPDLKTIRQVAAVVHMERPRVKRLLRLHAAPAIIKDAVSKGRSVLVKGATDQSDDDMEGEEQPNPSNPSAVSTRETRRLDLYAALELTKLHAVWTREYTSEQPAPEGTPDERISRLIDRALQQNWSLRRIEAAVAQLTYARADSDGDEPSGSPNDSPPFKENAKTILIYRKRLDQMSESQKAELKSVLEPIWNIVAGSSSPVPRDDSEIFSPRRWLEGVRAWAMVIQAGRRLLKLLAQHLDGPPPKQLPAGTASVRPQPPPAATTVVSPPPQTSAPVSPAVPKEQPSASNVGKAA